MSKDAVLNELKWFTMMTLLSLVQAFTLIGYILYTLDETGTIMIGMVVMIFRYQWDLSQVFHELSLHYSELVHMDTDVKGLQPILDDIEKLAHRYLGRICRKIGKPACSSKPGPETLILTTKAGTHNKYYVNFLGSRAVFGPIFRL